MHKHNLVIHLAPPTTTWREQARRALDGPVEGRAAVVEVRLVARPAAWEGRRHLEALDGGAASRPPVHIRPLVVAEPPREVATA